MGRGALIVFEGLDRAGKSTQCVKLVEDMAKQGRRVKHIRFPDRTTTIGKLIDQYLRGEAEQDDHAIHLLFSANRWELASQIREAIASGITVVIDRYIYSGAVYSAAKNLPNLGLRWARQPDEGLPRPDVCLFLELSTEEAARRGGWGTERYEKQELQQRVRELFSEMIASPDGEDIVTIDAGRSIDEVQGSIWEVAQKVCEDVDRRQEPLRVIEPW